MIMSTTHQWARRDFAAASAWAQQQPVGKVRDRALQTMVSVLAESDPKAALELQRTSPAVGPGESMSAYHSIFRNWSKTDPRGAAEAALQLPDGASRESALQTIASAWAGENPEDAFNWANNLPPSQGRNTSLQRIFSRWSEKDPAKASSAALARWS